MQLLKQIVNHLTQFEPRFLESHHAKLCEKVIVLCATIGCLTPHKEAHG